MKRSILRAALAIILVAAFLSFAPLGADSRAAGAGAWFGVGYAGARSGAPRNTPSAVKEVASAAVVAVAAAVAVAVPAGGR